MARSRAGLAAGAIALLAVLIAAGWYLLAEHVPDDRETSNDTVPTQSHVGSQACAGCHQETMRDWQASQHAAAMQHATERSVLGDFNDTTFSYQDVTSTFSRRDGKFYIRTDGPSGELADYEVRYTFGVYPLQQYLVELPGGRLQALSVGWDSRAREQGGQRWFRQYPDEHIDHTDELHWTQRSQNWNYMCADCHSTEVTKGYDASTDTFETHYAEISVGCEACHGPGAAHIEWASNPGAETDNGLTVQLDERRGISWALHPESGQPVRSSPRTSEREIEVCAQCHARRAQIAEGYLPGRPLLDHYLPSLLAPTLYHVDGQQQDEVFTWGSWQQSRMHAAGVTCSDCHDPHTQQLHATGNAVCAQCHAPSRYDAPLHHRHSQGSSGAQCVACHMPPETYMVIDPRRDHSMRVPRPDQSVAYGVPNACSSCHTDRDPAWAAAAVRGWLGRDATGYQTFAGAFHAAGSGDPRAYDAIAAVAADAAQPPIVRASALARLGGSGQFTRDFAIAMTNDPSALVRLAAVGLADVMPVEARAELLGPLLGDPTRAVRIEAARSLAGGHARLPPELEPRWQQAAEEYLATLQYTADRPEARVALGGFQAATGQPDAAEAAFADTIRMDPAFVPAYVNAADLLRAQGRDRDAAEMLQRGLEQSPQDASLHHALGLAHIRLRQHALAMGALQRAVELDPANPRYTYVYAVGLHSTGQVDLSIQRLQAAIEQWPFDRDMLMALTSFQLQAGQRQAARATATRLAEAYPDDPQVRVLAAQALGDPAP